MEVIGIILVIVGFFCAAIGPAIDNEHGFTKFFCGFAGGIAICIGGFCLTKIEIKNGDFRVATRELPEIKKEIFIDSENNSDTTYYYYFNKSDMEEIK